MAGIRTKWVWFILCALNTGCAGTAPFLGEPPAPAVDANKFMRRNEVLANRVSTATDETKPNRSEEYRRGFVAGYREGLETGTSEPPTSFWSKYFSRRRATAPDEQQTPEWSAGFRQGSAMAQESGVRALLTSPLSVPHADLPPLKMAPLTAPVIAQKPPETAAPAPAPATPPEKDQAAASKNLFEIALAKLTLKRQRPPEAIASARPAENTPLTHPDVPADSQETNVRAGREGEAPAEPQFTAEAEPSKWVPLPVVLSAADLHFLSVVDALP
jgi:hypothetical protein